MEINVKKTKSLRLGISKHEKARSGNKMIDLMDSFTYLGSIISKVLSNPAFKAIMRERLG